MCHQWHCEGEGFFKFFCSKLIELIETYSYFSRMDKKKLTFIEESGLMFEQLGMTRMVGRVFGYLLVSDQDEVSFEQIREVLGASKGSISGTTRQLIQIGLIEPVSLPGDRKTYFRITELELGKLLKSRMELFGRFSKTLANARNVKNREDSVAGWLLEASVFYGWIGDQIDEVIDKWHREKDQIIKTKIGTKKNE